MTQGPSAKKKNPYAKHIAAYYDKLKEYEFQNALHEGAVSTAFQTLLADTAKGQSWSLIPLLGDKSRGKRIVPDGTLKDQLNLVRGHWEAKDTSDDLDAEIAKCKKGSPFNYIVGRSKGNWLPPRHFGYNILASIFFGK